MRRFLLFFVLILATAYLQAAFVPLEQAREVARNVYFERTSATLGIPYENIAFADQDVIDANSQPALYVFNLEDARGFVVVAAEDAVYPVLAYAKKGTIIEGSMPPAFDWWMGLYRDWVLSVRENPAPVSQEISQAWERYSEKPTSTNKITTIGPLVTTHWDQGGYYNADCPGGSVTGCVATMMAQVLRYWSHPAKGEGYHSYTHPYYGLLEANFGETTYNWSNMPDVVSSPNPDVAQLMFHCGVSVDMSYSPGGSGANMGNASSAYMQYFKYSWFGQHLVKTGYTDAQWKVKLRADLIDGRPISYAGGSHAFVCDGFEYPDHFHFNMGWGGSGDAYYYITSIGSGGSYTYNQIAIVNVYPKEETTTSSPMPRKGLEGRFDEDLYSLNGLEGAVSLFPNPASGQVTVMVNSRWEGQLFYTVLDCSGRTVLSGEIEKDMQDFNWELPVDGLAAGIYTVSLNNDSERVNQKLIVR